MARELQVVVVASLSLQSNNERAVGDALYTTVWDKINTDNHDESDGYLFAEVVVAALGLFVPVSALGLEARFPPASFGGA